MCKSQQSEQQLDPFPTLHQGIWASTFLKSFAQISFFQSLSVILIQVHYAWILQKD